jgi:hypothetical protein
MNNRERKIQVVDFPKIPHTIKKYDNFQAPAIKQQQKKAKVRRSINRAELIGMESRYIKQATLYSVILLAVSMLKMFSMYSLSDIDIKRVATQKKLAETQREVEALQGTFISNFDLQQVEVKSKELGFIPSEGVQYVDVTN